MNTIAEKSHEEIEVKLKLTDAQLHIFEKWLNQNTKFQEVQSHEEIYLTHPKIDWIEENIQTRYLRIRKMKDKKQLCFKKLNFKEDKRYCDEYEIEISDSEKLLKIFQLLGFEENCHINKTRKVFQFQGLEINLDIVDELGSFVEIEVIERNSPSVLEEFQRIDQFLKSLGLSQAKRINIGYVQLMSLNKKATSSNSRI
ncbi:MAG: hypothetical protein K940chlam8_00485 [Chlamydiae bacterium]|nr:hypothetical protein [Chlamydiota bacterium]